MSEFLFTVVAFLVALGLLIAVHEFGHFWVARRVGVKVLRFSIGFGKPLWTWRRGPDRTEYVVAALPLGGYVKMLDEREGEVAAEELHRAFNRQALWKRFAVVAAGPLFNLAFAIVAYWGMYVAGVPGLIATVGTVHPGTPAATAGIQAGQTIESVAGRETPTWNAVVDRLFPYLVRGEAVAMTLRDGDRDFRATLDLAGLQDRIEPQHLLRGIGMTPYRPPIAPIIGEVVSGSVAEAAGLRVGDRILTAAGQPVADWVEAVEIIQAHPGEPMAMVVARDGQRVSLSLRPRAEKVEGATGPVGRIGAGVADGGDAFDAYRAEWHLGPFAAIPAAVEKTWEMSTLTLRLIGEMLLGRASVENISGPITIAQVAKESAFAGASQFLAFLAIVSVSLGVLNLLPVPILDGGHLMYYVVEAVKGSPVSEKTEVIGQKIGIILILALMGLAFYNDLARLAG